MTPWRRPTPLWAEQVSLLAFLKNKPATYLQKCGLFISKSQRMLYFEVQRSMIFLINPTLRAYSALAIR
jgi:hypothetical protein